MDMATHARRIPRKGGFFKSPDDPRISALAKVRKNGTPCPLEGQFGAAREIRIKDGALQILAPSQVETSRAPIAIS
jgi:hypothetical protein